MTPFDAAKLCQSIYDPQTIEFDQVVTVGEIVAGVNFLPNVTVVAFRGSCVVEDWLNDMSIWPEHDPLFGAVADGFMDDVHEFADHIQPMIKGSLVLTGHSLGAARACILSAIIPTTQLILFGCPKVGTTRLKYFVTKNCVEILSFMNHADLVCRLPYWLYCHVIEPTQIMSDPIPCTDIQAHEIDRYVQALSY
jgi:predicted lipase